MSEAKVDSEPAASVAVPVEGKAVEEKKEGKEKEKKKKKKSRSKHQRMRENTLSSSSKRSVLSSFFALFCSLFSMII